MNRKIKSILLAAGVLSTFALTQAGELKTDAFLVMLGSKTVNPEEKTNNNLDVFLGLAGMDLSAKEGNFDGMIEVLFFPAGYGFSYIQAAIFDSTTNQFVTKDAQESRTTIPDAWGRYTFDKFQVRLGRMKLKYSDGFYFGDYLHRGSGPVLDYGGNVQNATEAIYTSGISSTTLLLGVNDINLNHGYLEFREVIKPNDKSEFGLGYQGNIFDPIQDEDAEVLHNLSLIGKMNYTEGQSVFAEFGMRGLGAENEDMTRYPFMAGFTIPTNKKLNKLAVEVEYDSKRNDVDNMSAFSYGIYGVKKFGDHFTTILCVNNGSTNTDKASVTSVSFEMIIGY